MRDLIHLRLVDKLGLPQRYYDMAMPDVIKVLPNIGEVNEAANRTGNALGVGPVINRPDLEPQNAAERYGGAAIASLPAAAATILTGGAATPALLSSVGGSVAAQGAKDLGFGWKGQLLASLIGGGAGGATGVALTKPTVESIASTLGESRTMQEAGEHLQDAARNWLTTDMPNEEAQAWFPIRQVIGNTPTPLPNYTRALQDITTSGGPLAESAAALRPQLPDILQRRLAAMEANPTWNNVHAFRTDLGTAMLNPRTIGDLGNDNAAALYSALTEDLRDAAATRGFADRFDAANATSTALHDIAEGPIARIVAGPTASREDPLPEAAAQAALQGAQHGGTTLQILRQVMPGAVDELAAAHLRMQSPKYIKLNPQGTAPTALSPEAHAALIPDREVRSLIQRTVQPPGKPQASVVDHVASLNSALAAAALEHVLFNGGTTQGIGAALLGAGVPKGLQLLKSAGALPGILPGAAQGAMASPAALLGVTQPQPDASSAR
jgi:hypothetical protein